MYTVRRFVPRLVIQHPVEPTLDLDFEPTQSFQFCT